MSSINDSFLEVLREKNDQKIITCTFSSVHDLCVTYSLQKSHFYPKTHTPMQLYSMNVVYLLVQ